MDRSGPFLISELFCGTPPSCLKVMGGGWVAYRILVSAPVPFGLIWVSNWVGLGWDLVWRDWGLMGLGLGTRGLTMTQDKETEAICNYELECQVRSD